MISSDCDFEKFVRAIKGKNYYDVIYLAEKEATQAWRRHYHKHSNCEGTVASRQYQEKLIGLIDFMRHGLKPSIFDDQDLLLCGQLQNHAEQLNAPATKNAYLNLATKE